MKEQRSVSVPGINLEQDGEDSDENSSKSRPGTLYEVLMALKERERYGISDLLSKLHLYSLVYKVKSYFTCKNFWSKDWQNGVDLSQNLAGHQKIKTNHS